MSTDAEKEKREFLKMMQTAYRTDPGNEVISAENEYSFTHPCGVKLRGYPDRVEKEPDGAVSLLQTIRLREKSNMKKTISTPAFR